MENVTPGYDFGSLDDKPMDLMTLEQFELENPYTPPLPRRTANPLRTTSKNGQHTAEFHMACDARGVLCDFVFHTVAQGCFDVELRLGGEYVDRIGQYASKKDAKEEICKKHLATVEAMPNFKKRKANDTAHCLSAPAGLDEELWVNLIYEYTHKNQLPAPDFEYQPTEGNTGPWTCVLRVPGFQSTFGGHDKPYTTKMYAKKAAAMEAAQWLRSVTRMAPAPDKRRKSSTGSLAATGFMSETGATQALRSMDLNANHGSPSEQVHVLAIELGFTQPAYKHIKIPGTDAFYNSYAQFIERDVRKDGRLEGQIGMTHHVYGKKAAQQACAIEVLKVLHTIHQSRHMH
ncbi:uncharacterized protein SEPMUDRAFT_147814 [Sphaerulina musiva SO2202]|uniref:DRBM domain-containing protein n=1 Tax=Sphaerulina musiva (strain SO2202) TaxID=692275 RepID=M3CR87_SPHMS|nr:uncharacterized protein SEPMUDRAFT_147814 [Sphaerulina musiva SO2202]EMF16178.1 hypothetical protein SEPMUDRAFT_147814 [Sphaerulina musiva SO2202]